VAGGFRLAAWLIEPQLGTVSRNGLTVRLEPKVMEVLVCLARHAGEPVSKEELLQTVWPNTFVTDDGLKRAISELRRVFEDDVREPRTIQTIPKRGYRLLVLVKPINGEQVAAALQPSQDLPKAGHKWHKLALLSGGIAALLLISVGALYVPRRQSWKNASPPIHSIAVLPFQNLSDDPNQEYFCEGMTDALITDLAQSGSLKVISRTSSAQYKQSGKSLPQIGGELSVDAIVEGAIQKSGDRVRITAQLIHAPTDKHLWAATYERDLRDALVLERDLAQEIVDRVTGQIAGPNRAPLRPSGPANYKAFDANLKGNYHLARAQSSVAENEKRAAAQYFQQAIDADPDFVPAYIGLANAHSELALGSSEDLAITKSAAEKALALDPNSAEAWDILGHIKWIELDWVGAERDQRRVIALSPNRDSCVCELGLFLTATGRLDEGWREAEIEQELNPSEDSVSIALEMRGDHNRAIEVLQRAAVLHPTDSAKHYSLFRNYAETGKYKEAAQELESALTLMGTPEIAANVRRGFAAAGYRGAMREYAATLEARQAAHEGFFPENLAVAYTAVGDKDRAFYWLEQAYEHRESVSLDWGLMIVKEDHMLDALHSDPRFNELLRRVGLTP
jgi:TolB-like protein/DNA-binding winged helix-turn-helix (wHTH) protein/Tfp pilus assembly protein PilF